MQFYCDARLYNLLSDGLMPLIMRYPSYYLLDRLDSWSCTSPWYETIFLLMQDGNNLDNMIHPSGQTSF